MLKMNNYKRFEINQEPIRNLRRCTCCILPETMPFIEFDQDGICNYCKTYKKHNLKDISQLKKWADKLRRSDGQPDSIIAFSGGRDSSYGMHYFVKELSLKPIAYCYDWGMITDLAKRNQKRMCESLGIKLITVTADIAKKRENIRKNILAWLKKPVLGMIPLFMAGDKQYFYYADKVRKENRLKEILLASNPFEQTHFKSGFCGVKPAVLRTTVLRTTVLRTSKSSSSIERLPASGVLKMGSYYFKQYITNTSYINSSLADTVSAAISCFVIPHNYMRLYDYVQWNEEEVNRVLINEYGWEKAGDTGSTWRIGDGTAPFYNYVYYLLTGFSENDTMRCNQIREGMLKREEALELVYQDNSPRFDSMKWYFDAIGLDMEIVLEKVNSIQRLYNGNR
jgi:hypothetical protein